MAYKDVILADSPFAYWRMGDASSTQQDETAGNRDVTLTGATYSAAGGLVGDANTAVSFDGNDYGSLADISLGENAQYTIEAWVKFTDLGELNIYGEGRSSTNTPLLVFGVYQGKMRGPETRIDSGVDSNQLRPATTLNDGVWHHVAGVRDSTHNRAYLDGVEIGSAVRQTGTITLDQSRIGVLRLGAATDVGFFNGTLDEKALYTTALIPARILAHYNAGLGKHSGIPVPRRAQRRHLINR